MKWVFLLFWDGQEFVFYFWFYYHLNSSHCYFALLARLNTFGVSLLCKIAIAVPIFLFFGCFAVKKIRMNSLSHLKLKAFWETCIKSDELIFAEVVSYKKKHLRLGLVQGTNFWLWNSNNSICACGLVG